MASISPPIIAITLLPQDTSNSVDVRVTYTMRFAQPEVAGHATYREVCSIFGEDNSNPGFDANDDNLLGNAVLRQDLTVNRSTITRQLNKTFTRGDLNEDSTAGEFDELRALVTLTPIGDWANLVDPVAVQGPRLEVGI